MGDMLQENVNAPVLFPHLYQLASGHPKPLLPKAFCLCLRQSGLSKLYGTSTTFCKQNQQRKYNLDLVIPYAVYVHSVHVTHPVEFPVEKRNKTFNSGRLLDGAKLSLRQLRKQNILRYFKRLLTRRPQAVWNAASSMQSRTAYLEWEHAGRIADMEEPIRRGVSNPEIRGRLLHFLFTQLWQFVLPGDPNAFKIDTKAFENRKTFQEKYKIAIRKMYRDRAPYATFRTDLPIKKGSPPAQLLDAKGRKHTHARISNVGRRIRRVLRNKKKQQWLGYRADDHIFKAYLTRKVDRWFRRQFRRRPHPIDRNYIRHKLKREFEKERRNLMDTNVTHVYAATFNTGRNSAKAEDAARAGLLGNVDITLITEASVPNTKRKYLTKTGSTRTIYETGSTAVMLTRGFKMTERGLAKTPEALATEMEKLKLSNADTYEIRAFSTKINRLEVPGIVAYIPPDCLGGSHGTKKSEKLSTIAFSRLAKMCVELAQDSDRPIILGGDFNINLSHLDRRDASRFAADRPGTETHAHQGRLQAWTKVFSETLRPDGPGSTPRYRMEFVSDNSVPTFTGNGAHRDNFKPRCLDGILLFSKFTDTASPNAAFATAATLPSADHKIVKGAVYLPDMEQPKEPSTKAPHPKWELIRYLNQNSNLISIFRPQICKILRDLFESGTLTFENLKREVEAVAAKVLGMTNPRTEKSARPPLDSAEYTRCLTHEGFQSENVERLANEAKRKTRRA